MVVTHPHDRKKHIYLLTVIHRGALAVIHRGAGLYEPVLVRLTFVGTVDENE